MSYGLYDADLQFYPIPFYNLELMKLSSYYKRKREIVSLATTFSPQKYGHFIVRQDFYANHSYPINLSNIEYGGRAFTGDTYVPLLDEIEIMRPDISLYNRAIPKEVANKYKNAISTMQRAEHIRLSLDGATVWPKYEKQLRHGTNTFGLIIHDYDAGAIDGSLDVITDLLSTAIPHKEGRRLGMKFPVQIYDEDELYKWLLIAPMGTYYSLHYKGAITISLIERLGEAAKQSTANRQVSVNINNELYQPYSIGDNLRRVFRNIINLRTHRLAFPLIYDNGVFTDTNWKAVMQLINQYNIHLVDAINRDRYFPRVATYETLYSYVKKATISIHMRPPILSAEETRKVFQFVRENNYELFKDFYEYRGEEVKS